MIVFIFVIMLAAAYKIDPLFVYRYSDTGSYWIQPEQTSIGLIKNSEYDTVMIGSSVTQNFHAEVLGDAVGGEVLKVNAGGMSVTELKEYIQLIRKIGKAKNVYICIDLPQFAKEQASDVNRLKDYLMDDSIWNDYKYLLGYETWMRFLPLDCILTVMKAVGIEYPERIALKTDVDRSGEWAGDYVYEQEQVIANYVNGVNRISAVDTDNLSERMKERVDELLEVFDFGAETKYIFFFPPYSALYWYDAAVCGYYDTYKEIKLYLEEQILKQEGTEIRDFQSEYYILDLNNYRDTSHYGPMITEKMTDVFAGDELKILSVEQGRAQLEKLDMLLNEFENGNREWLIADQQ